jgi:hypothetical protein
MAAAHEFSPELAKALLKLLQDRYNEEVGMFLHTWYNVYGEWPTEEVFFDHLNTAARALEHTPEWRQIHRDLLNCDGPPRFRTSSPSV